MIPSASRSAVAPALATGGQQRSSPRTRAEPRRNRPQAGRGDRVGLAAGLATVVRLAGPVGLLTILFVLGAVLRVALGYLRPPAKKRFHNPERGRLAARIERGGDIVVAVTILTMLVFGYTGDPSAVVKLIWLICLLGGFAAYALAHYIASRIPTSGPTDGRAAPTQPQATGRPGPAPRRGTGLSGGRAGARPGAAAPTATGSPRRHDGGSEAGERPTKRHRPPPDDAPAQRRPSRPEDGGASPPASGARRDLDRPATDAPRRTTADRPREPNAAGTRRRHPAAGPAVRRPIAIPPTGRSDRSAPGDRADHKASPDDPTQLGELP